ncbi:DUF5684 domain-containing protein [Tenacibaculum sp. IMCC1]|uniref:Uncharacterized protein n=1 Tax=Tenacibaculum sp. Pbs-1 TaxID=3238748 RepID=A0AB33KXB9_9FLAO|nr:hypothetical protein BACT7_26190 [Tenacibaculum mesophilum]
MKIKEIIKISLTKSLFFVFLTTFLKKLFYLISNVQRQEDTIIIDAIFNQIYCVIIFGLFLLLAYKSYEKDRKTSFNDILTITLFYVLISYLISWVIDFSFYHFHEFINNSEEKSKTGLLGLMDFSPYHVNNFDLIQYFFITPYISILEFLKSGNFSWLFNIFYPPSFLIATIIIYFKSLYILFEKENKTKFYALIPILNNITLLRITNKPIWWIVPLLIPFIRFIPKFFINQILAKTYKKNKSFAFGMTFFPWFFYGKLTLENKSY